MLELNEKTGKWDYKVPVDATCLNTPEGCPAMYLRASKEPLRHLELLKYPGQPANKRLYKPGYEAFFNAIPVLEPGETGPIADAKFNETKNVVMQLAAVLEGEEWVSKELVPDGEFHRHIVGMEAPETGSLFGDFPRSSPNPDDELEIEGSVYVKKEGKELLVAHWGNNFVSPVHGHAPGLEVEVMLNGNLVVNRYHMLAPDSKIVRLSSSTLYTGSNTIELAYTEEEPDAVFKRQNLIHNFVSYGRSNSLHYVPEHTRDGRDNSFDVQYFDDTYDLDEGNTHRLTIAQAMELPVGSVLLVRSANVPAYRDHFVVITGGLVVKSHGIRQKDTVIMAKNGHHSLLDGHTDFDSHRESDTVILQLCPDMAKTFLDFHSITIQPVGQEFDDVYDLSMSDVARITTEHAMHLQAMDVLLVRSRSVPTLGDHYVVIMGHSVVKDHGIRPQTAVFPAMPNSPLLDVFDGPNEKVILLRLNKQAQNDFLNHYMIHFEDNSMNIVSDKVQMVMV
jgi:hypothetical protein